MKTCGKCGQTKPLTDFYKAAGTRDGLRGECKACNSAAKKAWYQRHRSEVIEKVRTWQRENPDRVAESRARRIRDPRRDRDQHLRRTFGITLEDYDTILEQQGGGCGICGAAPPDGQSLHVDHDHKTGVVRGLLCFTCNGGLGMLGEYDERLLRAADYVESGGFVGSGTYDLIKLTRTRVTELVAVGAGEGGN